MALSKIGNSLKIQNAHEAAGTVGCFLFTVLKKAIRDRDVLLQEA